MKVKLCSLFLILFLVIAILFSIFYKIQTFLVGQLVEFSGNQIVQVKKDSKEFYNNQKIYIKDSKTTYSTYVQSYEEDGNYYYLTLGKYFYDSKKTPKIWIYDDKICLGRYILKSIVDLK